MSDITPNEKAGASSPERPGQTNVSNANVMAHVRRNNLDIGFIKSLIDLTRRLVADISRLFEPDKSHTSDTLKKSLDVTI